MIYFVSGYLLSKEEGQPGTPEKPLSDLGRVSYHAYWKSVLLEFLYDYRDKRFTFEDVAHTTGMHMNDIALTFQLLGFVRYIPNEDSMKLGLCIDWNKVETHVKKVRSKPRLEIDPECLRWTPLLAPTVNPFRSPEEASGDQETETEEAGLKTESDTATEAEETPVQKIETTVEKEALETPVEVTSSGRRRTRPLKYSETTYQTTPTLEGGRKRKRELTTQISENNDDVKSKEEVETPRRQRSKSVARRSSRVVPEVNEEKSTTPKEPTYALDSQDSQEERADTVATPLAATKAKSKRKNVWRGRPKKRAKNSKNTPRIASPIAKKPKVLKEVAAPDFDKTDDSMEEPDQPAMAESVTQSPKSQTEEMPEEKKNEASSEDSSGEADDEMDVEEGEDRRTAVIKPATPRHVEENSTDHHTSDMELDSIHMDSPKSVAEKDEVINDTKDPEQPEKDDDETRMEDSDETKSDIVTPEKEKEPEPQNDEIKSPPKLTIDDKDTIIISESDDNNSQSCPLPSPKPNTVAPVPQKNENKPKEVQENDSPSKVIPVVSTENAHIVLDPKVQEEVNTMRPSADLVPNINQIETIEVEESDTGNSPHPGISPRKDIQSVINESPKPRKSPEKPMNIISEQRKCEIRKETVIQHQMIEEKNYEKKSPNKMNDSIIQNHDPHQREYMSHVKKSDPPRIDPFIEIDSRNKSQAQIPLSKDNDIPFRNDIMNTRKDEIVITARNPVDPVLPTYHQHSVSNSMTIQQINTAQHSYLNHRANVGKESQAVQTDKVHKPSEQNRVINNMQDPAISKPTKLEVPHPISSPVINPVIPKVPSMTDISFLPRCQSANAAVCMGIERNDLDANFMNTNLHNSLSGSMSIIPTNLQDKNEANLKPREKSKLREVRVNSAHGKEKPEKKSKSEGPTPRSTPEPKMFFPEQNTNTNARKPETSVPINVINSTPVASKVETKTTEALKKQDFFKKEKSNSAKAASVKHDKSCANQLNLKADQNDLNNKMVAKFKYDNEQLIPKADYTMNQIQNYHTPHGQYQPWGPPWDPARLQGSWEHNRLFDMKNSVTDKNYLDKLSGFNLPHLDQMQKSPQKLHQKDFHNIAYGALYATTGLPHYKETKTPTSKAECSQKNESKKQPKTTTSCQTQCESKKSQAEHMKQMMQRQAKQQEAATNCAEYRQQISQAMTSPSCKSYQNGPCEQKEIEKKSRQTKKEESPKDTSKEECEAMSPALQSMGVYTPDSTSNSVHSVHYPTCELDVSQLGLESPTSIGSDLASPCSMMHMHAAPSPQYPHSSIHIPPIMTQPNQPPKQQKINNRNR